MYRSRSYALSIDSTIISLVYEVIEDAICNYSLNGVNYSVSDDNLAHEGENVIYMFFDDGQNVGFSDTKTFYVDSEAPYVISINNLSQIPI